MSRAGLHGGFHIDCTKPVGILVANLLERLSAQRVLDVTTAKLLRTLLHRPHRPEAA